MNSEHMNAYQFCRDMYQHLRARGHSPRFIAAFANRSPSTLRRYMSEPGTTAALKPPAEVTGSLVTLINFSTSDVRASTQDEVRNQECWIDVVNGGIVPRKILAEIAGVDDHHLDWVGRSHPLFGIQPSQDQVLRAQATEALMQRTAA